MALLVQLVEAHVSSVSEVSSPSISCGSQYLLGRNRVKLFRRGTPLVTGGFGGGTTSAMLLLLDCLPTFLTGGRALPLLFETTVVVILVLLCCFGKSDRMGARGLKGLPKGGIVQRE